MKSAIAQEFMMGSEKEEIVYNKRGKASWKRKCWHSVGLYL